MSVRVWPLIAYTLLAACGTGPTLPEGQTVNPKSDEQTVEAGSGPFESCYRSVDFELPAPAPQRELFVVIDQTTALDPQLVALLSSRVADYLESGGGAKVTVAAFSATTASNFALVKFSGEAERPFAEDMRDSVNRPKRDMLDACLAAAPRNLARRADAEIKALLRRDSGNYANSEIIGSLSSISEAVRASTARSKTVLVVSDLLEHSSTTSFYQNSDIREIDLATEMQKVADRNQFGNFGGAKIYVIGAGLLPPEADQNATRNAMRLVRLREFWQNWFENSDAMLAAYGQPVLQVPLE